MANRQFSTAMVALDLSKLDEKLIRYAKFIGSKMDIKRFYFIHIVPDFSTIKNLDLDFSKKFAPEIPADEAALKKLETEVKSIFGPTPGADYECMVVEGKPYQQLLHWAEVKNADLVIVGKKEISEGSGIHAKRVARNLKNASVLFVTPDSREKLEKILVPIDYSENSARALKFAKSVALNENQAKITAGYVVDFPPTGYHLNEEEYHSFNQMLLDTAKTSYSEFLSRYEINEAGTTYKIMENAWHNIAGAINEYADTGDFDLLIIGAKGHTPFEAFMFGSVTEKIVGQKSKTPILVVR